MRDLLEIVSLKPDGPIVERAQARRTRSKTNKVLVEV